METGNRTRGKAILILLSVSLAAMLMLAGLRGGIGSGSAEAAAPVSSVLAAGGTADLQNSLTLLTALSRKAMSPSSPLRLILKWQGVYAGPAGQAGANVQTLADELGSGKITRAEKDGHSTYRAETLDTAGTRKSLFWSELADGTSYVIVTYETADLQQADSGLQAAAVSAGTVLQRRGVAAEWNVALQGMAQEGADPRAALHRTQLSVAGLLPQMGIAESYDDEATSSGSYTLPGQDRFVTSGDHSIAMQLAIHRDGETDRNRMTIGLPLITIEY
ncbi:hypothetical protein [Paenibacillus donghaensis]|uniref:TATA-box binding protein n=1 Tax=Paenibacillus donghaensis TaxID=414771 RepID=A0A2Z2KVU3_9BACL|nr:hypothetical protein [Paenibacillus donghaensis]ASA24078.1 hypothetical protein B9T62_26830 [Paenibacillus donghaensis]